ncbi:ABC transporter ATP-binding protein [Mammaliicoccus stepanovicii]|uniref:Teichoic acids export ATP-binding protein n=1 Tax=Mammaliicoccus stepanovicii TaxID=643214 RepID=A0A239ZPJ7_9STAP|nr:ABC transporter ATP-binding protein [Mammaliicoccus stepanovicii]PNZ76930.1 teichoic acid ABC transporter ATP-binding protein [Mammaliicoccus stepanovicii]GGI41349.1 hypothetical protein GCM10010896_12910 [Mammaliicoccus stepanovicii]SNV73271.1 teichoic acids export ATP-binding protein [Mammaliicoccus stepanovicii]
MPKPYKIKCENISKVYDLNTNKKQKLLSLLTFGNFYKASPFYALYNIDFEVEQGVSVGIIGLNGSGKSTLSNILGGVVQPTSGIVYSEQQPSLIAIGAGLNPEFTGIENIQYKCLMHGLTQTEINERIDDIIAFSELDDFIFQPLKSYSSGMKSRLGFAIAIHTDPDILIVDEALSVGDETFSNKCIVKMRELQTQGKTIFFVSHSASQIKSMCDKAMWIHYGELIEYGEVNHVVARYNTFIRGFKARNKEGQLQYKRKMMQLQQKRGSEMIKLENEKVPFSTLSVLTLLIAAFIIMIKIQIGL